jgi:ABC-type antimicrobial peptide transport system permease subunit
VFAAIGAVLAALGIYGMLAGTVSERRKEFGIRLALGASSRGVLGLVIRNAVLLAGAGALAGLAGTVAVRRTIEARLYGVTPLDPATLTIAGGAAILLSIVASLVPAVRAARVDPVRSLRVE